MQIKLKQALNVFEGAIESILPITPPRKIVSEGVAHTPTFNPSQARITAPTYTEHTEDLYDSRISEGQDALMKRLFNQDPDVSATVNAYLTVADTDPLITVYDADGEIDPDGIATVLGIVEAITSVRDYSQGFQPKKSLRSLAEGLRYSILLRGSVGSELILNKARIASGIRLIDAISIEWEEALPGQYKPFQKQQGGDPISLDYSTVFFASYHQNPFSPYTYSTFVGCINTIAARQEIINTLYRIMRQVGFPRMTLKVMEEVILKTAPQSVSENDDDRRNYVNTVITDITTKVSTLRADQPFVHTDALEPNILVGAKGGAELKIQEVIDTLNDQNQAALKVMKTIIGRGDSGINTSSTEARIFSMNADSLNNPVAEQLSNVLTLALRLTGYDGRVELKFKPSELRPITELEPQLSIRQARLQKDLSLGVISDNEYHLAMYGRLPPAGAPMLSGTGFLDTEDNQVEPGDVSANSDPLGRSLSPEGSDAVDDSRNK